MTHLTHWENICWDRTTLQFLLKAPGTPFNDGWKFAFDPEKSGEAQGWQRPDYDASAWNPIGIDTGWESQPIGIAWKRDHGTDYDGHGWYRKSFSLDAKDVGCPITLTFGAVDEACTVWVNGQRVLDRPYPYKGDTNSWNVPFSLDLAAVARPGLNTIVVRVVDTAGQGGIWRFAWLKVGMAENKAANLVKLPDFEDATQFRASWDVHCPKGKFQHGIDTTEAHSGQASYRMTCTERIPNGVNIFEQAWMRIYQRVPLAPGKTYRMRVWYKTQAGFTGKCYLWLIAKGKPPAQFIGGDTNGLWSEAVLPPLAVPDGITEATIYLNSVGALGTVWFDDIEVVPVDTPASGDHP